MLTKLIPEKTIGRLSLYRRILSDLSAQKIDSIFSHQLAALAGKTAAQVRRDLMNIGFSGSPTRGYDTANLVHQIGEYLDPPKTQNIAVIGVGNLGRALLSHFPTRRPNLSIVAAFDTDPGKTGRVIQGCHCYPLEKIAEVFAQKMIRVAILAIPATEAQGVADMAIRAGATGIMNFARVPLRVPAHVYVENIDMTMSLEKVAFFARQRSPEKEEQK